MEIEQQYLNHSGNIPRINQLDSLPFPNQEISQTEQSQTGLFVQLLQNVNIPEKNVIKKELTLLQKALKELQALVQRFGFQCPGKEVKKIMIEVF
jgi:hypothetical protein